MLFNIFIGGPMFDKYLYDCDGTSPYLTPKIAIGIIYFLLGTISQILYVLVLYVIKHKPSLFSLPCYKIMFGLGMADICSLFICADLAGIYSVFGLHPCYAIYFTYATGCLVFGFWHMSCLYVIILSLNRVLELIAPLKCNIFFKGNFLKVFLFLPIVYFIYFTFFTKPTFFQVPVSAFLLNPMTEITKNHPSDWYTVEAYVFNNFFVMVFIGISYIIICSYLLYQSFQSKLKKTTSLAKRVTYQCVSICGCHFIGCFLYVYIQYFPMPDFLNIICHLAWIGNHGLPPFVYMIFNRSVRQNVFSILFGNYHKKSVMVENSSPTQNGSTFQHKKLSEIG